MGKKKKAKKKSLLTKELRAKLSAWKKEEESKGLLKRLIATRKAVKKYKKKDFCKWPDVDQDLHGLISDEINRLIEDVEEIIAVE